LVYISSRPFSFTRGPHAAPGQPGPTRPSPYRYRIGHRLRPHLNLKGPLLSKSRLAALLIADSSLEIGCLENPALGAMWVQPDGLGAFGAAWVPTASAARYMPARLEPLGDASRTRAAPRLPSCEALPTASCLVVRASLG
jgi:hypothetical protein